MKVLLALLLLTGAPRAAVPPLVLPTDNDHLYKGDLENFYMYVDRYVDGKNLRPWSGGQYGFVRTLQETEIGVMATKFHEGIDIRPVNRDRNSRPIDQVRAIADGVVVYVNNNSSRSNYGKYIVIQHDWGEGPVYSLYAHLSETLATVGKTVTAGSQIAVMGYTGAGINLARAHLHLEICLILSDRFDEWFEGTNYFGLYHGHNLAGMDAASLLLARKKSETLTLAEFQEAATPYYKVTVPRTHPLQLAQRYPWMKKGDHEKPSPSWEISFTDSGLPHSIAPSNRLVNGPTISYIRPTATRHEYFTSGRVTGTGRTASLSANGLKYLSLITQAPQSP